MKRTLFRLTLLAAAGVAMLAGLGTWQVQRLSWKQELMDKIEARVHADPVPLSAALQRWSDSSDVEYLHVRLSGRFQHESERHLYTVVKGRPGWRIVAPLKTHDGAIVMVDRGFVPVQLKDAMTRAAGQIEGEVTLNGLARATGRKGAFAPASNLEKNTWYWRDLAGMAASVLDKAERDRLVPFFVESDVMAVPGGWPKGGVTRVNLSNRHLEYAVTWYGLALALVLIYCAIVWRWRKYGEFT